MTETMPVHVISRQIFISLTALFFCVSCENSHGIKIADAPPPISDIDINGKPASVAKLKGKVVVIYFWIDSCCGDSLKYLVPMYERNRSRGLEILAVNSGDSRKTVADYVSSNNIPFQILLDERRLTARSYGVTGFPTIYVIDRSGTIHEKVLGLISTASLEKMLLPLLEANSPAAQKENK